MTNTTLKTIMDQICEAGNLQAGRDVKLNPKSTTLCFNFHREEEGVLFNILGMNYDYISGIARKHGLIMANQPGSVAPYHEAIVDRTNGIVSYGFKLRNRRNR